MATTTDAKVMALDETQAWSTAGRTSTRVEVLEGDVLVTLEGDERDRVLAAGARFDAPPRRRVAATGLSPSRIRVSPATELPVFDRLAHRDGGKLARHLLGGTLILAVWLSLWTWVAVGVAGPLSAMHAPETAGVAGATLEQ